MAEQSDEAGPGERAGTSVRPAFAPLFRPSAVTPDVDPFERAVDVAADGAEPGTLVWSQGSERCACAVVLAPEQPLEPSLPVLLIAALALGDALGALAPPVVSVTFGWPDRVEINGGLAGGVRLAHAEPAAPQGVPDWIVVGFRLALQGSGPEPGHDPERTTLADEGCGDITALDLLEAFSRHFLAWINRWQEDGVRPVQQAWLARATGLGKPIEIGIGGRAHSGTFSGLTEHGGMRLTKGGVTHTIPLSDAIRAPTWTA